eukprot:gene22740-31027_t
MKFIFLVSLFIPFYSSVALGAAAYCGTSRYEKHTFLGPTEGFVLTKVINDIVTDTEGFVGYLPSDQSIYVVYRGTYSVRSAIDDLKTLKTRYKSYPDCRCEVHKGFYLAEQNVITSVTAEVNRLKSISELKNYAVKTTGHSLGAALAQLTAMDLINSGFPTTVYNFGQPRVGDKDYAKFSTDKLKTFRVVHNKDIVPHLPFTTKMDFYHSCTEVFEDSKHNLRTCSTSSRDGGICEDSSCADQYKLVQTKVSEHLFYLGMRVNCQAVSDIRSDTTEGGGKEDEDLKDAEEADRVADESDSAEHQSSSLKCL